MTAANAITLVGLATSMVVGGLRWLRVAQREHYLVGSVSRFAWRWWSSRPVNLAAIVVIIGCAVASFFEGPVALAEAAAIVAAPLGLSVRGRTSPLVWTRRLGTLAAMAGAMLAAGTGVGAALGGLRGAIEAAAVLAALLPQTIDAGLTATRPLEEMLAARFVNQAAAKLRQIAPRVVAITGSYGKTTTKGYVAHLVGHFCNTLASPASYNNRGGLSRAVNEHMGPATEVFVAEMGTYGPGEIAALCSFIVPEIAVITAIGPAHLERFRSLDRTLLAKSEITERARVSVLNVDDERLALFAHSLESAGRRVVGASGRDTSADVAVIRTQNGLELWTGGSLVSSLETVEGTAPSSTSNVACAVAAAMELGFGAKDLAPLLSALPSPPNRLEGYTAEGGYLVLDDTFNSNPLGARMALSALAAAAPTGRRVLVTPGMVELGPIQAEENAAFAEEASRVCSDIVVVARTNRVALLEGARRTGEGARARVLAFDVLPRAVEWVKKTLVAGDAVLYENDLPDHFP